MRFYPERRDFERRLHLLGQIEIAFELGMLASESGASLSVCLATSMITQRSHMAYLWSTGAKPT